MGGGSEAGGVHWRSLHLSINRLRTNQNGISNSKTFILSVTVDLLDLYKAAAETTFSTPILPLAFVYVNKVEQWTKTSPRNKLCLQRRGHRECLFSPITCPFGAASSGAASKVEKVSCRVC